MDKRIDRYIAKSVPFVRPILTYIRDVVGLPGDFTKALLKNKKAKNENQNKETRLY